MGVMQEKISYVYILYLIDYKLYYFKIYNIEAFFYFNYLFIIIS